MAAAMRSCVVCAILLAPAWAAATQSDGLSVTRRTDEAFDAVFIRGATTVSLTGRSEGRGRAVAQIRIGDLVLDVRAAGDLRAVDGHGAALSSADKQTLVELSRALEQRLEPWTSRPAAHVELVFRAVLMWSEAPAGWPFATHEVRVAFEAPSPVEPGASEQPGVFAGGEDFLECSAAPCEVDADDGVTYLACALTVNDQLSHDASPDHCYCREALEVGCDFAGSCLGRCGAGCGGNGSGPYTKDCAEHDRCCGVHGGCINPFDAQCGDEYSNAIGDFLSAANCTSGCEPHAGRVPATILLDKSTTTPGDLTISWSPSCTTVADDYGIYEGDVGSWYAHEDLACSDTGGDGEEDVTPGAGNHYYLVVPSGATGGVTEGSYGRDSSGTERPVGTSVCVAPQQLGECP